MGASFCSRGDEPLFLFHAGLKEANDIVLYLKPLRILLEEMEQADFTAVHQHERVPWLACRALGLCLGAAGFLAIVRHKYWVGASLLALGVSPSWSRVERGAEVL